MKEQVNFKCKRKSRKEIKNMATEEGNLERIS